MTERGIRMPQHGELRVAQRRRGRRAVRQRARRSRVNNAALARSPTGHSVATTFGTPAARNGRARLNTAPPPRDRAIRAAARRQHREPQRPQRQPRDFRHEQQIFARASGVRRQHEIRAPRRAVIHQRVTRDVQDARRLAAPTAGATSWRRRPSASARRRPAPRAARLPLPPRADGGSCAEMMPDTAGLAPRRPAAAITPRGAPAGARAARAAPAACVTPARARRCGPRAA